ncbi:DNA polymerase alpha catalytic subunit, partial [Trichinella spiralis]|uniref:DNA polymerase alpha catalytic subunit n=1 Tax=Trichinella spiralis TaxID=6334 RepID=UPI0001EFE76D
KTIRYKNKLNSDFDFSLVKSSNNNSKEQSTTTTTINNITVKNVNKVETTKKNNTIQ